jgi:anion-transporting  ArsA/GET3 family ATPase
MSFIVTFLGKGGSGRTTTAIAAAQKLAQQGSRVLLAIQDTSPTPSLLLDKTLTPSPSEIGANLKAVQLSSTQMLENSWEQVKDLESQYLRSPTLKNVYGQELGILPGMDSALALNALREYDKSGQYDVIVYDGVGDITTLRMLGIPDVLGWYLRRFRQVFTESDIGRALSPFVQPITSAILNVSFSPDELVAKGEENNILEEGKKALNNANRVAAYLVTTDDAAAMATAKYLWGSAQQIGLTVKGVLLNQSTSSDALKDFFKPLDISSLPTKTGNDWQPLMDGLPNLQAANAAPSPTTIDLANRQVKVFLPGFDKKQVKLTQYGLELTIDAGCQRRNIDLPAPLRGQPVKGAKFQDNYLIISF